MDKKTILVVDDAEINRMTLTAMFEDEYDILEATDGAQALKVLKSNAGRIAMILLDIIMSILGMIISGSIMAIARHRARA